MSFGEFSSSNNKGIATILNKFFTSVADRLKPQPVHKSKVHTVVTVL